MKERNGDEELTRDQILDEMLEQNERVLRTLSALDRALDEAKHAIRSRYHLRAYHPALAEKWRDVAEAYRKAEEQMKRWSELTARTPLDVYERLEEEALTEARERNRDLKKGDIVVLIRDLWLGGTADKLDGEPPTASKGQHFTVVGLGDIDEEEEEAGIDDVREVTVVVSPDDTYIRVLPLTSIVPLAVWGEHSSREKMA